MRVGKKGLCLCVIATKSPSYVYIFSKRRFSDYAVAEVAKDWVVKLVELERLRG